MTRALLTVTLTLLTLPLLGCEDHGPDDHDGGGAHVHVAPHGGSLVEVGDHEANLEFVRDQEDGSLTVWVLGPHAQKPLVPSQDRMVLEMFHPARGGAIQVTLQQDPVEQHRFRAESTDLEGLDHLEGVVLSLELAGKKHVRQPFVLD
ncbi:MAG: hypothetical protein R3F30_15825 [Planctomycetota bacterium]